MSPRRTAARLAVRLLGAGLALACLLTVVAVGQRAEPDLAPAADLTLFEAGNIITDAVFYDSEAMSAAQVQKFLDAEGANCQAASGAPPCLRDYAQQTASRAADSLCGAYSGAARESAATIIKKVATACDINPRVLLVTLQKEMGFITSSGPTWKMYSRAMGYACPDNNGGVCDSLYNGFFNQLYSAAKQFQRYAANPTRYGHVPGLVNNVRYHPNTACGSSKVLIENQATASLYNYTPYQPNQAALAAGYGAASNSCSSYGNRNFWNYFTDWFGSTQTPGRDVDAPVGDLEVVADKGGSVLVRGWTFDPNDPAAAVTVHVYVGGTLAGRATTGLARPDVASRYPGTGPAQGFEGRFDAATGDQTVCVYPVNILAGYSNPRLGCGRITITPREAWNPVGALDNVAVIGSTLRVDGWSFDPDAPRWPSTVRIYAGRTPIVDLYADHVRLDVGEAYPHAGAAHGFTWVGPISPGTHKVCAYSINKGSGTVNPRLGCKTVTVVAPPTGNPKGRLAGAEVDGSTVTVRGWAFDPDVATSPVTVRLYAGSTVLADVAAGENWPDVGTYYPYAGSQHGFSWSGTLPAGTHRICAWAINQGPGTANPYLGCRTVTVTAATPPPVATAGGNPKGRLDTVRSAGTRVRITGWSFDPDVPTAPVTVRLYAGSTMLADVVADGDWPDVGKYYPYAGSAHGFDWVGRLEPGQHRVCAWAINQGTGTANPRLGCRTLIVG